MPLNEEQEAHFNAYNDRVNAMIERARKSRAALKNALADRQMEMCVDIYREYALSLTGVDFQVSHLIGTAVRFAVQMGMHEKANQIMSEAECMCPPEDTALIDAVKRMRAVVDQARAQNYHPLKKSAKAKRGRLH